MAFRFKDKERPRGYTSKVAGLLHVSPLSICKGCFQGDAVQPVVSVPADVIRLPGAAVDSVERIMIFQRHIQTLGSVLTEMVKKQRPPTECSFPVSVSYGFRHSPAPLGDRKLSWVHSFLWEKWTWSQIMTNSFAPSPPRYILDPFFTRHISSEHSGTKMASFRHTHQEEVNFVRHVSVSATHSRRTENWCLPPCFEMDINNHLNGLMGETMNKKLKLTSNRYHTMHNPSALFHSHDVNNTSRLGGGIVVPYLSLCDTGSVDHFGTAYSGVSCVIFTVFGFNCDTLPSWLWQQASLINNLMVTAAVNTGNSVCVIARFDRANYFYNSIMTWVEGLTSSQSVTWSNPYSVQSLQAFIQS